MKSLVMWTCDLDFSLCTVLSVCYMVTTSDNLMKSKRELSTDSDVLPLNTGNQV